MPRKDIPLPPTSRQTLAVITQLKALRQNRVKRDAARQQEQDDARKARIGARLVHLVRRGDQDAEQMLDRIRKNLQPADRPAFEGWSPKPDASDEALPVVTITDRYLPRTLAEIDAEIARMTRHREQQLKDEAKENKRNHSHRMIALGGGLLALVHDGSAEADLLLERIVSQIPAKQRAPFKDWDRPRASKSAPGAAPAAEATVGDKGRSVAGPDSGEPAGGSLFPTGTASPASGTQGQQRKRDDVAQKPVAGAGWTTAKSGTPDASTGDSDAGPDADPPAGRGGARPDSSAAPVGASGAASTTRDQETKHGGRSMDAGRLRRGDPPAPGRA